MWNGLNGTKMAVTFNKAYWMPIVVFIWFPVTFIITYITAVMLEDVPPVWPYISDTGTFPPEACIFGQFLNTGSILMAVVIYLRYRHVAEVLAIQSVAKVKEMNKNTLWLGLAASFGVSVVGNFQETNLFTLHLIGAGVAFGGGTVYQALQTVVSWRLYPLMGSIFINRLRILLTAICIVCSNLTFIFAVISFTKFDGTDITKWTNKNTGYKEHLLSTINEWITAICTVAYLLTFADELRYMKVVEPEILLAKRPTSVTGMERY